MSKRIVDQKREILEDLRAAHTYAMMIAKVVKEGEESVDEVDPTFAKTLRNALYEIVFRLK